MFSPSIFTNSHSPRSLLFFGISENAGPSSYLEQLLKFDDNGNLMELNNYDSNGQLNYRVKSQYDNNENITEQSWYYADGELTKDIKFQYDKHRNATEISYYKSDGELDIKYNYQYEYDGENNWILKTSYANDKVQDITEREIEYYE